MSEQTVDLTNCDREPIHIPGSIQPHGMLLVMQPDSLTIVQVSDNTQAIIARQPQDLLNKPLSSLFNPKQIAAIRQCLAEDFENVNPLDLGIKCQNKLRSFDGIVYQRENLVLLELERKTTKSKSDFFYFYQQVKGVVTKIQQASTLGEMCQTVAREMRKITGFDRIMIYQFDADGSGIVIAEDTNQETPYLNLRYPASDIPKQARQLYTSNWLRLIPDRNYQSAKLIPSENPLTGELLDLSLSGLRSVSPIHLEYLENMGVRASMSISLIQERQLWGLIACHHSSPKYLPYGVRNVCEFIGQVMSLELAAKEKTESLDYKMTLKSLQTSFIESLSQSKSLLDGLVKLKPSLPSLVNATGAVVCFGDRHIAIGQTPPEDALPDLLTWLKPLLQQDLFHTQCLSKIYPEAESFKAIASGLLALEISKVHRNYILWFRPEVLQTISWGGNPDKAVTETTDGTGQLSPRKSFELWQEEVTGYSLPWKPCEIEAVAELRSLMVGVLLRQSDELASINIELRRSNEELDSFAYIASHDLKEPLRGIHNYSNFLMEDHGTVLPEEGVRKLQTLVRLTQHMEDLLNSLLQFSRLGRAELLLESVDLQDLVQQVIATLSITRPQNSIEFRIPRSLPTIKGDRTQINELFTNLISNAIKYNDQPQKWVEIGWIKAEGARQNSITPPLLTFYVRDNGIGIAEAYLNKIFQIFRRLHGRDEFGGGTGAGLTIARKIVERHGGRMWVESTPGRGSTFYFTLMGEKNS
jgi:two-component system, chemotaxis family, sensor kinase Cph1